MITRSPTIEPARITPSTREVAVSPHPWRRNALRAMLGAVCLGGWCFTIFLLLIIAARART